ncbi:hypothetical protein Tco_0436656 [Tanacetum coccineum]
MSMGIREFFYRNRIINNIDGDDLAFPCMIGFRKFVAYSDPFLPMNIITRKAYNTIMVEGLKSIGRNLVAIVKDVYVFVGSFTYVMDLVISEDIWEFLVTDMSKKEKNINLERHKLREKGRKSLNSSNTLRSLNLYPGILCHLAILCLYPHAHYIESLLTISLNIDLILDLLSILSLMFFEEVLVHQSSQKTLTYMLLPLGKPACIGRIQKNLLDRVLQLHYPFLLPERLKADNTIRVNQIVTIFMIESSIHLLDQNRYPVDTSLIHIESRKSPTAELFNVDSRRTSIFTVNTKEYHFDVLENITRTMHSVSTLLLFGDQRLEQTAIFSISTISE